MGSKLRFLWPILFCFAGGFQFAAEEHDWNEGSVSSIEKYRTKVGSTLHQYVISVGRGELQYTIQCGTPLKVHRQDSVKFRVDGQRLVVFDTDGKKRQSCYLFTTKVVIR
jgi:hypothetical protein